MSEMTREQRDMAVAVAKDAILQLSLPVGAPKMEPGTYLDIDFTTATLPSPGGDLQEHVDSLQKHCHVCQVGVMFLSFVRLYDNVPTDVLGTPSGNGYGACVASVDEEDMRGVLNPVFGKYNVARMEAAFEGWSYGFRDRHPDPKERAVAILENLIENDGMFIPFGVAADHPGYLNDIYVDDREDEEDYPCDDDGDGDEEDDDEAA